MLQVLISANSHSLNPKVQYEPKDKRTNSASEMFIDSDLLVACWCKSSFSLTENTVAHAERGQLEAFNEARTRSDTIIMQLSQQIDRQQLQLEDMRRNRSILARIREVFIPSNT